MLKGFKLSQDVHRAFGFNGRSNQMPNGIYRCAGGDRHSKRVAESLWRQDLSWGEVGVNQLEDLPARLASQFLLTFTVGADRCAAGQRHTQGLGQDMHGVGCSQSSAD